MGLFKKKTQTTKNKTIPVEDVEEQKYNASIISDDDLGINEDIDDENNQNIEEENNQNIEEENELIDNFKSDIYDLIEKYIDKENYEIEDILVCLNSVKDEVLKNQILSEISVKND